MDDAAREKKRLERQARKANGLCTGCGKAPPSEGKTSCQTCQDRKNESYRKHCEEWRQNRRRVEAYRKLVGRCPLCGVVSDQPKESRCSACVLKRKMRRKKEAKYQNDYYQKKLLDDLPIPDVPDERTTEEILANIARLTSQCWKVIKGK